MSEPVRVAPWERKADEGDDAYAAFLVYRDLGPYRTLDLTRRRLYWRPGDLEPLRRWSDQWDWDYRTNTWDDYQQNERDKEDAAFREVWEARRREALEGGWKLCQSLRGRLAQVLEAPPAPMPAPEPDEPAAKQDSSRGYDLAVVRLAKLIVDVEWMLVDEALPALMPPDPWKATDDELREFLTRHPKIGRPGPHRVGPTYAPFPSPTGGH